MSYGCCGDNGLGLPNSEIARLLDWLVFYGYITERVETLGSVKRQNVASFYSAGTATVDAVLHWTT